MFLKVNQLMHVIFFCKPRDQPLFMKMHSFRFSHNDQHPQRSPASHFKSKYPVARPNGTSDSVALSRTLHFNGHWQETTFARSFGCIYFTNGPQLDRSVDGGDAQVLCSGSKQTGPPTIVQSTSIYRTKNRTLKTKGIGSKQDENRCGRFNIGVPLCTFVQLKPNDEGFKQRWSGLPIKKIEPERNTGESSLLVAVLLPLMQIFLSTKSLPTRRDPTPFGHQDTFVSL